jgi:hypothetical protein
MSFEDEGLYPVTLLYAANAGGQSGLEFAWQVTTNNTTDIIPQSALYISPDLGDRLITFEEFPAGSVLSNQFAGTGVVFRTISGNLQITTNFPGQFVPVSPTRVFGCPDSNPTQLGEVELTFVTLDPGEPATSDFVSFFIIDAETTGATVAAFDTGGLLL